MVQVVSLKNARTQLSELIGKVAFGSQSVVITRFGKPVATVVNYQEYERLMNPRLRFPQMQWENGFKVFDQIRIKNRGIFLKEIEKGVEEAKLKVREEKNVKSRG